MSVSWASLLISGVVSLSNQSELLALLATLPSGASVYPNRVPNESDQPPKPVLKFPYVLVRGFTPRASDRSLNRTVHAEVTRWRLTVVGLSHDSVAIIDSQVRAVLEGARIDLQRVEEVPTGVPIEEDLDVKLASGLSPFFIVTEWQVMH